MLPTNTKWEIRNPQTDSGSSDTNGGGYVPGGSGFDWSQQSSPQYILSGLSGVTGNTLWAPHANLDMINNVVYCSGGFHSNTKKWYQVLSVIPSSSMTFSTNNNNTSISTGAASGITLVVGGALASPGQAVSNYSNANFGYLKYSTAPYLIKNTTAGSGGPLTPNFPISAIVGYENTRGDSTNRPLIKWNGPAQNSALYICNGISLIQNVAFDGAASDYISAVSSDGSNRGAYYNCTFVNFSSSNNSYGVFGGSVVESYVSGCYIGLSNRCYTVGSLITDCTYCSYDLANMAYNVLVNNCDVGFLTIIANLLINCTVDDCNNAFANPQTDSAGYNQILNSIASNCNVGYTVYDYGIYGNVQCNCAQYNCGLPISGTFLTNVNFVNVQNQPYTENYLLNNVQNGGSLLRGSSLNIFDQYTNADIGATRHFFTAKINYRPEVK